MQTNNVPDSILIGTYAYARDLNLSEQTTDHYPPFNPSTIPTRYYVPASQHTYLPVVNQTTFGMTESTAVERASHDPPSPSSSCTSARSCNTQALEQQEDAVDLCTDKQDTSPDLTKAKPDSRSVINRREEVRQQRMESEQRRRSELSSGYRRLKEVLPVSSQKSSKASLVDRATAHIHYLEVSNRQLQDRLRQTEQETQRLRQLAEALMLKVLSEGAATPERIQDGGM